MFFIWNQELSAVSVELPDVLKSLQLRKLKENEAVFLKDLKKTLAKPYVMKHQVKFLCRLAYQKHYILPSKEFSLIAPCPGLGLGNLSHISINVIFLLFHWNKLCCIVCRKYLKKKKLIMVLIPCFCFAIVPFTGNLERIYNLSAYLSLLCSDSFDLQQTFFVEAGMPKIKGMSDVHRTQWLFFLKKF